MGNSLFIQRLIQQLHENDEAAFAEVYQAMHNKAFNFILRYVRDSAHAQELTQILFVKLWEKRQQLTIEKSIESQLFMITRNLVIDNLRKEASGDVFMANYATQDHHLSDYKEELLIFQDQKEHFEATIEPPKRQPK